MVGACAFNRCRPARRRASWQNCGRHRLWPRKTTATQSREPLRERTDEPELGLHPYAISLLADLVKSAAERTQAIISTQSPMLLNYFEPAEIVVVNRRQGSSTFVRLDADALGDWMEEYSVGELWQKNVVQGGPASE
ncbi:MAG: AAA family ATPase [Patescibacteria group bacterium]|nr:AAA family ATPase [Patescibacteria group bacterium]